MSENKSDRFQAVKKAIEEGSVTFPYGPSLLHNAFREYWRSEIVNRFLDCYRTKRIGPTL